MAGNGQIVILNGASSAGKTTIAASFRDRRAAAGDLWVLMGIDDYLAKLPIEWLDLGLAAGPGRFADDGMRLEHTARGPVLRIGAACRQLLRAYQAAVAGTARSGLNVIVDEVVVDTTARLDWQTALAGLDVVWVGVRCAPEVAEQRELARGDRAIGMTRSQTAVHADATYAFEIDTTALAPLEAIDEFMRRLGY